jgi:ribosome maturation factor RimP
MKKEESFCEVEKIIKDLIESRKLDFIEVKMHTEGRNTVLRVFVDKPEGGICLGECSDLNRTLGVLLEEKNIFEGSYILEVSSPGLDRPLKTAGDFGRNLGKSVKFFLNEPINGKIEWDGVVKEIKPDCVNIDTGSVLLEIGLTKINKAKLLI